MITFVEDYIKLDTKSTTLLLKQRDGFCEILHYGNRIDCLTGAEALSRLPRIDRHASVDDYNTYNRLFSFVGDGNDRQPFLLIRHADGSSLSKFRLIRAESVSGGGPGGLPRARNSEQTLALTYLDAANGVEAVLTVDTYAESDVLTFSSRVTNRGSRAIEVERLFSVQIDTDGDAFDVYSLDGAWIRERTLHRTRLQAGTQAFDTFSGFSSNKHNPFFAVSDAAAGGFLAFQTVWSGNHKFLAQVSPLGQTRFLCGLNDFAFSYRLESGESLYAPQTAVLFAPSLADVTAELHAFIGAHIVRETFCDRPRPVLLNSWEAMYFDYNESKLLALAAAAKDLGIELFVLDDGWFEGRDSSDAGLGDWTDDTAKTGGIDRLSAAVKAMGMQFGIWVEPEMISPDSRLYRAHPEYALARPGEAQTIERRKQLVLDLVNPSVSEAVYSALCAVFDQCRPDYVKWDCNRFLTDIYSPFCANAGAYAYRYMRALYTLLERLTARYPNILFEGCSAGGNRFDLGILCYMPQIWASDNTDARARVEIQAGTLLGYPQSAMTAHVSVSPNHQTGQLTPLKERFIVACGGVLGYELDVTRLTPEEAADIRAQIAFYKAHRTLLQFGQYRRIRKDDRFVIQSVSSPDGSRVIVSVVQLQTEVNRVQEKLRLGVFDPSRIYRISLFGESETLTVSGGILNEGRLDVSQFLHPNDTNAIRALLLVCSAL